MKVSHMLAALGLAMATLGAGAPAEAQRYDRGGYHGRQFDRHDRGNHFGRDRDWRRHGYGRDGDWRRHGYGYGNRGRDRCWTEWRRNHRVRVCR